MKLHVTEAFSGECHSWFLGLDASLHASVNSTIILTYVMRFVCSKVSKFSWPTTCDDLCFCSSYVEALDTWLVHLCSCLGNSSLSRFIFHF